ncbi:MAG: recombinase A [Planctomycetota bacterium]
MATEGDFRRAQGAEALLERGALPAGIFPAREFLGADGAEGGDWGLSLFRGRLAEISGSSASAVLTLAFDLVTEAQGLGEPAAWISERARTFFPPDAAAAGADLERLAVILVPSPERAPAAADTLVRSGGFGLVVVDLAGMEIGGGERGGRVRPASSERCVPLGIQSRLAALAKRHGTAVVFLTEKPEGRPSLGPLVSLRVAAVRRETTARGAGAGSRGLAVVEACILKDKRRGARIHRKEFCHGPPGWR